LNILNFEFKKEQTIRTILIDNEPYFVVNDVTNILELSNSRKAVADLLKRLDKIGVSSKGVTQSYSLETAGGKQILNLISEIGLYELIFASKKTEAIEFRYWITSEVLPEIRKTGSYSLENSQTPNQPQPDQNIVNNIFALNNSIQILRPSEASKILMTEKLYKKLKLETNYLPKYTDEKLTRSLTYLLKKYEIKLSTQKANLKLLEAGILEKLERDSSCGNKKYFYSITENGLKYGKNLISPKNERETQPHFFEDRFLELVKLF
jgi:prophage antirepressor-like protein